VTGAVGGLDVAGGTDVTGAVGGLDVAGGTDATWPVGGLDVAGGTDATWPVGGLDVAGGADLVTAPFAEPEPDDRVVGAARKGSDVPLDRVGRTGALSSVGRVARSDEDAR
jgi:hypothetical protein